MANAIKIGRLISKYPPGQLISKQTVNIAYGPLTADILVEADYVKWEYNTAYGTMLKVLIVLPTVEEFEKIKLKYHGKNITQLLSFAYDTVIPMREFVRDVLPKMYTPQFHATYQDILVALQDICDGLEQIDFDEAAEHARGKVYHLILPNAKTSKNDLLRSAKDALQKAQQLIIDKSGDAGYKKPLYNEIEDIIGIIELASFPAYNIKIK